MKSLFIIMFFPLIGSFHSVNKTCEQKSLPCLLSQITQKYQLHEVTAYLLEKKGDIHGAFLIMLKVTFHSVCFIMFLSILLSSHQPILFLIEIQLAYNIKFSSIHLDFLCFKVVTILPLNIFIIHVFSQSLVFLCGIFLR